MIKLCLSFLKALRIVFFILLLAFTLLFYVLLETPIGLGLINTYLPLVLPFTLKIDHPQGSLMGPLTADKVVYRDDTVDVEVSNARITWEPWKWFNHQIKIDTVTADQVKVIVLHNGKPSTLTREKLLHNLTLPFSLLIEDGKFNSLAVEEGEDPWVYLDHPEISALMDSQPHFTLKAQWTAGKFHLIPDVPLTTSAGRFSVDGQLPHYQVFVDTHIEQILRNPIHIKGSAEGDFSGLDFKKAELSLSDPADFSHYQEKLSILYRLLPKIHAVLLDAPMKITWLPHFDWEISKISGQVHAYPFSGQMHLRTEGSAFVVEESFIQAENARAEISGRYDAEPHLQFTLKIPEVKTFFPEGRGSVNAQGKIEGDVQSPRLNLNVQASHVFINSDLNAEKLDLQVEGEKKQTHPSESYFKNLKFNMTLSARNIHYFDDALELLNLDFDGSSNGNDTSTLDSQIKNLSLDQKTIDSIEIHAQNKSFIQTAHLDIKMGSHRLSTELKGHYQNELWQGVLQSLKTNFNLQLKKAAILTVSSEKIDLNSLCVFLNNSAICTELHWQKNKTFKARINSSGLPLSSIAALVSPNLKLSGSASLNAEFNRSHQGLDQGFLNLVLSDGTLRYNATDTPIELSFQKSQAELLLSPKGLSTEGQLNLWDKRPLTWKINAPNFKMNAANPLNTPVSGQLQFNTDQLKLITHLYPQFKNIQGQISADIKIGGSLALPQFWGNIALKNGKWDIPALGLHLDPIELLIQADHQFIRYSGKINAHPGILTLQGQTDLRQTHFPTELRINGNQIQIMNTSEYRIIASPALKLSWRDQFLNVEGSILVPKAEINPIDLGDTVTLSDDVVFIDKRHQKSSTHFPIRTQVNIILGDAIHLKVKGLTARLSGSVNVRENEINAQTNGIGQINIIDGRYKAYGQDLKIRTGRAMFTGGPVTNPGLYVEAVRTVSTYSTVSSTPVAGSKSSGQALGALQSNTIVGARVTGSVDTPVINFFSEPGGLTQSQILSYLVLGKPESSGSDFDTTLLLKAVSFLDLGGDQTAETKDSVEKDLGLDELSLHSGQEYSAETQSVVNNTSLVLGKALSPKLFVDYSIGLIEPINILQISYQLSKHFTLRSESNSNAQGIDVFYSIEKD